MRKTLKTLLLYCLCLFWLGVSCANPSLKFTITGFSGKALKNVNQTLTIKQQSLGKTPSQDQLQFFLYVAKQDIQKALEPYGYFKSKISLSVKKSATVWEVEFAIEPGPRLHWTSVDVKIIGSGSKTRLFERYLEKFPIKTGNVFSAKQFNRVKQRLFTIANNRGYLKAKMLKSQIQINIKRYTAKLILHFDTGPRFRFGDINFNKSPFKDSFLRKFLTFKPGSYYSTNKLQETQENLSNSSYFQAVDVKPEINKAKNLSVPIMIRITPKKSQTYSIGAGYGTDTGIRGILGVKFNRLTSTGQQFQALLRAAEKRSYLLAKYTIPGKNPATDRYALSAAYEREDQDLGSSDTQTVGISYVTLLKGWQQTLSLKLYRENYKLLDNPRKTDYLLVPSASWLRIFTDHPLNPKHGWKIDANIQGASSAILARTSFLNAVLNVKTVQQLTKNIRLVARGSFGVLSTKNVFDVPYSFQLLAGGAQSIRGYTYNSIGPGNYLYVGSVALQHRVYKDFYGSVFFDAGDVNNKIFSHTKKGVGIGVVWLSPVGSIELSVAKALDLSGKPIRIQFSMGPEL